MVTARFESLAIDSQKLLAGGRGRESAEALRQARALWRGAPCAVCTETVVQGEVARLQERRAVAPSMP